MYAYSPDRVPKSPEALVEIVFHDLGRLLSQDSDQRLCIDLSQLTPREIGLLDRVEARIRLSCETQGKGPRIEIRVGLPDRLTGIRALIRAAACATETTGGR